MSTTTFLFSGSPKFQHKEYQCGPAVFSTQCHDQKMPFVINCFLLHLKIALLLEQCCIHQLHFYLTVLCNKEGVSDAYFVNYNGGRESDLTLLFSSLASVNRKTRFLDLSYLFKVSCLKANSKKSKLFKVSFGYR